MGHPVTSLSSQCLAWAWQLANAEQKGRQEFACFLLQPFWPMGTGCARGFLAAFDTAWMVKSWDQGTPPLELLAER